MQGMWVQSLIWEALTCGRTVNYNYWTCAVEFRVTTTEACALQQESHRNEKRAYNKDQPSFAATRENPMQQWRPSTAQNQSIKMTAHYN